MASDETLAIASLQAQLMRARDEMAWLERRAPAGSVDAAVAAVGAPAEQLGERAGQLEVLRRREALLMARIVERSASLRSAEMRSAEMGRSPSSSGLVGSRSGDSTSPGTGPSAEWAGEAERQLRNAAATPAPKSATPMAMRTWLNGRWSGGSSSRTRSAPAAGSDEELLA